MEEYQQEDRRRYITFWHRWSGLLGCLTIVIVYLAIGVGIIALMHLGHNCGGHLPPGEERYEFGGLTNQQPDCPPPLIVDAAVVFWPVIAIFYTIKFTGMYIYHVLQFIGKFIIHLTGGKTS